MPASDTALLNQITRDNVKNLTLKWVWRPRYLDKMESTPIVVDGVLYAVQNSEVVALDGATGRNYWTFRYHVPPESNAYVMVVKGLAFAGDRLFWATYDGHLIAIDAKTGDEIWNQTILDWKKGLQLNVAPLVVKDKVILGPATNEFGTNCWIAAYDVSTGSEVWRFKTVPEPGEKGNDTWPGDSWKHGGAPIWVTGAYDPVTNLTFWGTGNPNPRYAEVAPWEDGKKYTGRAPAGPGGGAAARAPVAYRTEEEGYGAVRALDPATGEKKWDFKMVDYTESGVLTTASDLLFSGGREGHFFAFDARNGELLWTTNLGGNVANGPITFAADGHQYVAVAAEGALYVFGLRD